MNRQAAFHQPMPLSCGHVATAIMHMKQVDMVQITKSFPDTETSFEATALLDHIEYIGVTIKDSKLICMICGKEVLEDMFEVKQL